MKVVGIILVVVGIAAAGWIRSGDLEVSHGSSDLLKISFHNTPGVVCDDGSNGENVANVACGGSGTASSVASGDADLEEGTEFALKMTCAGTESSLTDCEWKMDALNHCDTFVAASCDRRRSYVL